jgi:regulator of sirC expression with transglutaminase-like and TPR domain
VKPVSDSALKALVSLLDDDSHKVARVVRERILAAGHDAKPYLAVAVESPEEPMRSRARLLLDEIEMDEAEREIEAFAKGPIDAAGLEVGAFLVSRIGYPELDRDHYVRLLDEMAATLREQLKGKTKGQEILRTFADTLFHELRFSGNSLDYYDADNSYLNRVLDRRTGIPITLSLVYLFLARRVGLKMEGVGFPGHFVVRFSCSDEEHFVDAFNYGRVLSRSDCARFLIAAGFEPRPEQFVPSPPREILCRMLRNLLHICREGNDKGRADRLTRLIAVLEHPPTARPR